MKNRSETEVSVGFLRDVIGYAVSRGASESELCNVAGIDPAILSMPDTRISGAVSKRLWAIAEEVTGDTDIGLHIGENAHPATLGLVGYVMLCSTDLCEALSKLIRFTNLLTDGVSGNLNEHGRLFDIDIEIARDRENFLIETPRQPIESSFSAIVTVARFLTGKSLPLREVWFEHSRPKSVLEHRRIFGRTVLFSQPKNKLVVAGEALRYPVLLANRSLLPSFEAQAEQILNGMASKETRTDLVRREIVKKLKGDVPGIESAARELNVSARTLQRELASEGTSFRAILEEVRREISLKYLRDKKVSIAEVSFLLGFSEPSAFHRSFRRWFGKTPQSFRTSASNQD
jgi:AraC-like DNA-binding protein